MSVEGPMPGGSACADVAPDLAELALGVLTGEDRARALAHVERCEECAAALARLGAVADGLLAAHPEADPPEGFSQRVVSRLEPGEPVAHRPVPGRLRERDVARPPVAVVAAAAAAVAAVALVAGAGFVLGRTTGGPGGSVAPPVGAARPLGIEVAGLRAGGRRVGQVYAHGGSSPWLLVNVDSLSGARSVTCEVTATDGRTVVLGSFWIASGRGSWAVAVPLSAGPLRGARLAGAGGAVLASATFSP
ncbi:MAG: hypothetical protein M0Z33_07465 [Actinomycetota bacterium]|nr:hypothetical protein [Actinomycetota bacterium]